MEREQPAPDVFKVMARMKDGTWAEIADGTGTVPARGDELRIKFPDGIIHLEVHRRVFDAETLGWEIFVTRSDESGPDSPRRWADSPANARTGQ